MRFGLILLLVSCGGDDKKTKPGPVDTSTTTIDTGTPVVTDPAENVLVTVTLDGAPVADAVVLQAGGEQSWLTDAAGQATVEMDSDIRGEQTIFASVPSARNGFANPGVEETLSIDLVSFDPSDNIEFIFENPGTPADQADTEKCAHCHITINDDWYGSVHQNAASNPAVQDIYAGTAAALTNANDCTTAGGSWWSGVEPGTRALVDRCYLGAGALPDLNAGCGDTEACDGIASDFGGCADCHAPGIDGVLGGRDLLEAEGFSYDYGIHCDVCHLVESVDLSQPPGVAGALHIVRPSEIDPNPIGGIYQPLTFGPRVDIGNPRMGSVQRDHYRSADFCGACHQLDQPVLVPGQSIDPARWTTGTLPIHTTWGEWAESDMNPVKPCQDCHMPAAIDRGNGADLNNIITLEPGLATGWERPIGSVHAHTWEGPRDVDSNLLATAAMLTISNAVANDVLTSTVTVTNNGAGHALPTGEPLRSMVLVVTAECTPGDPLVAIGGDAVPDFGGALDSQDMGGDWAVWPGAQVGDVVRVVTRPGGFYDYPGFGPFGDGFFDAAAKGMPIEQVAGQSTITGVAGDDVTFDQPLPPGDVAHRVRDGGWPVDGGPASGWAGAPGFAFGKVLVDADGRRLVPHHRAVDVASDNRLPRITPVDTTHIFDSPCPQPTVTAALIHRAYPLQLALERGWTLTDLVMLEVVQ